MPAPDLNTKEGRAAYRKELRAVGRPLRAGGLALVVGAAVVILMTRQGALGAWAVNASYFMLAAGWVMVLAAIWMRTRHHKRRLAEGL